MSLQLLEDGPSHFTLSDGRRQFKIAKKGLGTGTVTRIQRFARGGEVQRLALGDEVGDDLLLPEASVTPLQMPTQEPMQSMPPVPDPVQESIGFRPQLDPNAQAAIEQSSVSMLPQPETAPAPDIFQGRGPLREQFLGPQPAPQPAPAMPQAPTPAAPRAPGIGGYRPSPFMAGVQAEVSAASNAQQEALRQQAQFQAQQYAEMQRLQAEQNRQLQQMQQRFQQRITTWQQQADQMFEDARNARVDPTRYWQDKSSLAKAGSVISIILSGIGQGLQNAHGGNAPNLALAVLEKAIDHDIEAQKFNVVKQNTLLGQYLQMGNSMLQSEQLVRAGLKDVFAGQMLEAAYKSGGPQAIAIADAQAAALRSDAAKLRANVAAVDSGIQENNAQVAEIGKRIQLLDVQINAYNQAVQAENAKKLGILQALSSGQQVSQRDLYRAMGIPDAQIVDIPGAPGQARIIPGSKEDQKTVREMAVTYVRAGNAIDRLTALADKNGSKWSFDDAASAKVEVNGLIGQLRLMLTGPGAFSEGERKLIEDIVANPTKWFSFTSSNKKKLETLRGILRDNLLSTLSVYTTTPGLQPPGSELGGTFTPRYANED